MVENALHLLVKSLSKSQKRYFKLYFNSAEQSKSNYIRIFEIIEAMPVYDELKFQSNFSKNELKKLPSDRNYLYEQLLKSMRAYMSKKNAQMELSGLIQDIQFLYHNNLMKQCMKRIRKAEKLAKRFEYYSTLVELLEWEVKVYQNTQKTALLERLDLLQERRITLLERQSQLHTLQRYSSKFFHLRRSRVKDRDEKMIEQVDALYSEYQKKSKHWEKSFYMETRILGIEINYLLFHQQYEKASDLYPLLIEKWEERPDFIKEKASRYKSMLNNHLFLSTKLSRFSTFEETLAKIKSYPGQTMVEQAQDFQKVYLYELIYYIQQMDWDKCKELIPELERGFKRFRTTLSSRLVAFYYNLAVVFFITEEFETSEKWLNKALNIKFAENKDTQKALRWHQVINYFETTEPTTVEYILSGYYRYIRSNGMLNKWDKLLYRFFRKLVNLPKAEHKALFSKMADETEAYTSSKEGKDQLAGDEILSWLRSRANGVQIEVELKKLLADKKQGLHI